jgi:hypothetical protein
MGVEKLALTVAAPADAVRASPAIAARGRRVWVLGFKFFYFWI